MQGGLSFGHKKIVQEIVTRHWGGDNPMSRHFNYNEVLFILQELFEEEGKKYFEEKLSTRGYNIFRHFVEHLLYRNIANYDSMLLLTSEKGCITEDSLIEMPRNLKEFPDGVPIKNLLNKKNFFVYSFNINTQQLEIKKAKSCEFVKIDDVWEVELTNGQKITATEDHPFLLTNGKYKQLKDLIWKDYIDINGKHNYHRWMENNELKYTDRLRVMFRPDRLTTDNFIKYDYSPIDKKNGDTTYKHAIQEHRLIAQHIFGSLNNKIVHHKNGLCFDNRPENLEIMTQKEHYLKHKMTNYQFQQGNKIGELGTGYSTKKKEKILSGSTQFKKFMSKTKTDWYKNNQKSDTFKNFCEKRKQINPIRSKCQTGGIIKSIKYKGKQKVYDVVGVEDNHNFIANKFVVSNTGKSSAGIMMCREWCRLIGIKFNPERHIAYNNVDVMRKIDSLNKFEPLLCVAYDTKIRYRENGKEKTSKIKYLVNKKNIEVLTFNVYKNKFEYYKPKLIKQTGWMTVDTILLENGSSLQATSDHPILTENGYKEIQHLSLNDKIIILDDYISLTSKSVGIKKISVGRTIVKVYDIIGIPGNHNFCANDVVVHNCDEAIRFASSEEWAKKSNKELKKRLAQVRTKHLFYVLCFPLKVQKVDKVYLEANVNYWIDLFARGRGAIYVKDKNPSLDSWRIKEFTKMGSYTEFTSLTKIQQTLKKHPNFWQMIKFPKPPEWLYTKYLKVREKNVYDDDDIFKSVSKEDIHKAILVMALNDIMQNDVTLTMNRIILHIKNEHDIILSKGVVQAAIEDSRQLVLKIREQGVMAQA